MSEWWMPAAVALAVVCLVLLPALVSVALLRAHRTTRDELELARQEQQELRAQLERLATRASTREGATTQEFVITGLGDSAGSDPGSDAGPDAGPEARTAARIEGRLFADIVLRESVVKAASWGYGLRRALSAEHRNRVRFEVRRETRRTTKRRKADTKEALRQYYARERGDVA